MSIVINHSRKLLIAMMKEDLNYRLQIISSRMQRTAAEVQKYTEEKTRIQQAQMDKLIEQGVENITLAAVQNIGAMTSDIDTQLSLLAIKDDEMDCEMKNIETQLQTLNAEEEQIDKVIDNSAKKEFGIFSN